MTLSPWHCGQIMPESMPAVSRTGLGNTLAEDFQRGEPDGRERRLRQRSRASSQGGALVAGQSDGVLGHLCRQVGF